ncbi:MAG TPA: DUF3488 and transglutaminase-like domain-containing protein [Nocardioidaceae bacterium]|nr:DUF3488 and transglutaminase-like domain-containing protein [Nocardioidaceae bacterium]
MRSQLSTQTQIAALAWLTTLACALAFNPLIEGSGYLVTAALVTAVPMLAGGGLRAARVPGWLVLVGQLAALLVWITALYADGAALGFLPTPAAADSIRLLLESGLQTAQTQAPPAPADTGLVLLTVLGIAACHMLVDWFAATLHRVPLTGLPLLALYTVPAAISADGVPTLAFVVAAAGFVMLLASDERSRLGQWGRHLTHAGVTMQTQRRVTDKTLGAAAQRVGVLAIGVAALVPLLLPSFPDGAFGRGDGDGPGDGGTVNVSNPIVDIRRELRELSNEPAMTVRTTGPAPEYFRLAALDEFDGRRWQFSPRRLDTQFEVDQQLAPPPGLDPQIPTRRQSFEVDVTETFRSDWLPAPYAPSAVQVNGDWRYSPETMDIISADDDLTTAGLSYRLTSVFAQPSSNDLATSTGIAARITATYTDLPEDLPEQVGDLTDSITGVATRYEKAVALQEWFREPGRFVYTLEQPSGHSSSALVDFLIRDRRGYCEQFAAAMAVMARHEGIPARVAVGFLRGTQVGEDEYQFTYADMHAWPELYFEGAGWVRFEPTPAAREGSVAPGYSTGDLDEESTDPTAEPTESTDPTAEPNLPERELDPGAAPTTGGDDAGGGSGPVGIAAAAVLVLAAALPALLRALVRRRRWSRAGSSRELAEAAWAELRDTVIDLRRTWPATTTPRRTAALLQAKLAHSAAAEAALHRLALAVERARFARTPAAAESLRDDLGRVEEALRSQESRMDRLRARVLPRSLRAGYGRWNARRSVRSQTRDDDASALPSAP